MSNGLEIPENYKVDKKNNNEGEVIGLRFISPDESEEIHIFNPTTDYPNGCIRKLRKTNIEGVLEYYKLDGSWTQDETDINTYFHIVSD